MPHPSTAISPRRSALTAMPKVMMGAVLGLGGLMMVSSDVHAADPVAAPQQITPSAPSGNAASLRDIYRVSGDRTPSGFDVPRFVSLKFGKVNARTGPSRNHPIAYQYQRRGLPLVVVAETEMWRKVRDIQGDEAWVRKPALSGTRFAMLTMDSRLYSKSDDNARTVARVERGALVQLEDCTEAEFCRVRTQNGVKGYAPKRVLWGAQNID